MGITSPFSQRRDKVIKKGKHHVGVIPLGSKHSWLLRRDVCLSPLNLAPWNLSPGQELSLDRHSRIPLVKVPRMSRRKASVVKMNIWQRVEGERPRVENSWMGQVWPRVEIGNAGTILDPHLDLLVPPLSLGRGKTRIPHTWLGIKQSRFSCL